MVKFNFVGLRQISLFCLLAAWCAAALNADAQAYPQISGTYKLTEIDWISTLVGGQPDVETHTNIMTVDVIQHGANFWIVLSGTTPTSGSQEGTLSGNSVVSMIGPVVSDPSTWSVYSNGVTAASGTVFTNQMHISLDGAASGIATNYFTFKTTTHSDLYLACLAGTFTPLLPPTITAQPSGATNVVGGSVSFSVAASGATNFTYQWRKDGNLISGATDATYTIDSLKVTDAGSYMVQVANIIGSANSSSAVLKVNIPATIKTQPASARVYYGVAAKLSVVAAGTAPFTYQWRLDGTNIPGATNASHTFTAIPIDAGLRYSVTVSNAFGGALSGDAVITVVRDPAVPHVTIATPAASLRSTNFHLSGAASHNGVIASVTYWITNINNGVTNKIDPANATLSGTNPISRTWSADPSLLPGTNIVAAYSSDLQGSHSSVATRQFFYRVPAGLAVTQIGQGAIVGKSSVSGAGEAVPTSGNSNHLYIGQGYSVQAKPSANWLFSNWTKSMAGVDRTVTNQTLSFIMEPGLTLTATFATNPFVAFANTYNGSFNAGSIAPDSSGLLRQFLVTKTGAFSGQLVLNGVGNTITGAFGIDGRAVKTYAIKNAGSITLDMTIAVVDGVNTVTGIVTGPSWTANLNALPALANLASSQRAYVIPPDPAPAGPAGYGVILATNTGSNVVLTITLADGVTTTVTSTVLSDGTMPIYASLYNRAGVLAGWVSMTNTTVDSPVVWIKKTPNGFTNTATLMASKWTAPTAKTAALPFTAASPGLLEIHVPTLPSPLSFQISVLSNNTVVKLPGSASTNSLAGTVDPKTGAFKLTCGTTGRATAAATGVVLQSTLQGYGICGSGTNYGAVTIYH